MPELISSPAAAIAAEAIRKEQIEYREKSERETNPVQQRFFEAMATGLGRAVLIVLDLAK